MTDSKESDETGASEALEASLSGVSDESDARNVTTHDRHDRLAREHLRIVAAADFDAVDGNVTPDYVNHRSADEPMGTRQRGPDGLKATIRWLHRAFTDIRFEFHDVIVDRDRVAALVTMHGQQHGPFVVHDSPDGEVTDVFPSMNRAFSVEQTHWFRIADGAVAEHDAVRDDLGMAKQLGWIPPRPDYLIRMVLGRWRERHAQRRLTGRP
ncbi:ester cyclase [Halomarina pelagica]|uniref:ester cyclase n=1 Tax=Halomarina pelagica TaxID=2961599 RepID=UPI0020C1BABE|nr:ester cyclase [Halomarina sp. BND7]